VKEKTKYIFRLTIWFIGDKLKITERFTDDKPKIKGVKTWNQ
jgi:hypothetical protein